MRYISTRGQVEPVGFCEAVLMGLADDGGLLIPEQIPDLRDRVDELTALSYPQLAEQVMAPFVTDLDRDVLGRLIRCVYERAFGPEVAPVVPVGDRYLLELWHGPTLAFKDIALQLLGELFDYILASRDGHLNVLGATSGDTGSAAIAGCRGRDAIDIFMMHPRGRVSPIQERQMTTVLDANVHNLAVEGSFDDCQRIMKTLAADVLFKQKHSLGAVNSVNWARVLAQIVYYFFGAFAVRRETGAASVRVAVPTGNFGDILAGWYAKQMGAPISRLILATNENDILCRFFRTGEYAIGEVHRTLAPSMDIQVASNFERYLYYKLGRDPARLRGQMEDFARTGAIRIAPDAPGAVDPDFFAGRADTPSVLRTIRTYYRRHDYVLDPHTACGVAVADAADEQAGPDADPVLCLATAHPAKFPDAIRQATGEDVAHHPEIDRLMDLPTRCKVVDNDPQAVREFIVRTVG